MATTALPRPSRPALNPPTGPLPSLPRPKTRKTSVGSVEASEIPKRGGSPSSIATSRSVSSNLPTRPKVRPSPNSSTNVPTANKIPTPSRSASAAATPHKTVRKTISIGSFPQPPKSTGKAASHPASPLSMSSTHHDGDGPRRQSAGARSTASAGGSGKKPTPSPRTSSVRKASQKYSGSNTPSLLNGSGGNMSISSSGLLSLPSESPSGSSSGQDSYATSATTFEDLGDEHEIRGRDSMASEKGNSKRESTSKDGKGNVLVSVRVRPDNAGETNKSELEWMVDGRRSLISYKGAEGGEYYYGTSHRAPALYAR